MSETTSYDVVDQLVADGHDRLLIGGEWTVSSDGEEIEVVDPSTGAPITSVPSASAEDARAAVDAASGAAAAWAETSPTERSEILRRSFEMMTERTESLARLIVFEMGKTFTEAMGEIRYAAEFFRWYSGEAVRNDGTLKVAPGGDKRIVAIHQPVGVSLLITPWNFPAAMATRKIGPAIAAGCTMILKPASDTPLTALAVGALLEEAGLPPGVLNVLPSSRSSKVVPVMLGDSRVRKLSFTGSTEVGRTLLANAAEHIVNCSMELGGNAPFVVFDDADIESAVEGAMVAKMRNGGQSCIAANRFFVHSAVADEFGRVFSKAMAEVRVGPGLEDGVDLGPMINLSAQTDLRQTVEALTGTGARVSVGGGAPDRPGYFFEPTVIEGVGRDDPTLSREIFGPVAPLVTFDSEEEAVALANDTIHGLAAYVYSADLSRAMRVSEAIESGMVGINRGLISDPAAPFGGVKESGLGREGSSEGLHEFLETKYIAVSW
jgi:succinate-semialdehyde dehydrogenase/glutarate-semialdehyde dehydrogenase